MNIRKRGNSYQIRKQYKGKQYVFTLDHKPSQKEVIQLLADVLEEEPTTRGSFESYCERYIESKNNTLSPSTIRGYVSILANMGSIKDKNIYDITQEDVQREINEYGCSRSPKSTKNVYGFISSVLAFYRPNMRLRVSLPQRDKKEPYIPSDEEIKAILNLAKGTEHEIALWLACYGLRRGEICALTKDDLSEDNMLTINKSLSEGISGKIIKLPKTSASIRTIAIPSYVADLIREKGYIYRLDMQSLLLALHRFQDKLEIPRFRLHNLRHYFASTLSSAGVPENDLLKMGGWATPSVMKTVYRHSMLEKDTEAKKKVSELLAKKLDK